MVSGIPREVMETRNVLPLSLLSLLSLLLTFYFSLLPLNLPPPCQGLTPGPHIPILPTD